MNPFYSVSSVGIKLKQNPLLFHKDIWHNFILYTMNPSEPDQSYPEHFAYSSRAVDSIDSSNTSSMQERRNSSPSSVPQLLFSESVLPILQPIPIPPSVLLPHQLLPPLRYTSTPLVVLQRSTHGATQPLVRYIFQYFMK